MRVGLRTLVALCVALPALAWGQAQSVKPGINDSFRDPNVTEFVERFEREGREVYDHRDDIVKACRITPGETIADIGAGTGLFTRLLAQATGKTGQVYAVDIAENFVRHVEETARREGLHQVTGVVCQPDDCRLPAESVDRVFICDTYHHFEFPQRTMATIHRALRPGGELVLVEFHRIPGQSSDWILGHIRAPKEVFVGEVVASGFEVLEEREDFFKESYLVRFRKRLVPRPPALPE